LPSGREVWIAGMLYMRMLHNKSFLMKTLLTTYLIISTFIFSWGQENTKQHIFKPFSVIIIKPDDAQIADTLSVYAESIEAKQSAMYLSVIRSLENRRKHSDDDEKRKIDAEIHQTKERAKNDRNFKYFHSIAFKTLRELKSLFNSNEIETDYTLNNPVLTGEVLDHTQLRTLNEGIGESYKADYIVSFENIHTAGTKQSPTFRYVVKLLSTATNEEILRKEIEGNTSVDNYKSLRQIFPSGGHERGIHCDNYLECMIISAVRSSTEELFKAIEKRQKK
jgi:hypothetical protein